MCECLLAFTIVVAAPHIRYFIFSNTCGYF
jgi:hypothetical protein